MTPASRRAVDGLLLALLKSGAIWLALRAGFAQISDDDYARTVIAQTFAHAPKLDPTGTSWLPFPFWLSGGVMLIFGRTLEVARGLAFVLGVLSPFAAYAALRTMQFTRIEAWSGAALAALSPWSVWLAAAPVPDGWVGFLVGAALLFASRPGRPTVVAGVLVLIASLSRYEAWPAAAIVCVIALVRAFRARPALHGAAAATAALGPIAWMAHNARAHGDAFHFLARVAAFRRAHAGELSLADRIWEYPLALLHDAPEIVAAGAVGAIACVVDRTFWARWRLPLLGAAAVIAFLIYGDVRDGAPTHHAARALVSVIVVLAAFGATGAGALLRALHGRAAREAPLIAGIAFYLVFAVGHALSRVGYPPGNDPSERRDTQLARGRALRAEHVTALEVTPCQYEHFALLAAFGSPELATVNPSTKTPLTPECPVVRLP